MCLRFDDLCSFLEWFPSYSSVVLRSTPAKTPPHSGMSGGGMIGKHSMAFVGMVAGGLAGVLGAYISLAATDMLSSSQLLAAATAGAATGLYATLGLAP